jgi:hypothetical protein
VFIKLITIKKISLLILKVISVFIYIIIYFKIIYIYIDESDINDYIKIIIIIFSLLVNSVYIKQI